MKIIVAIKIYETNLNILTGIKISCCCKISEVPTPRLKNSALNTRRGKLYLTLRI